MRHKKRPKEKYLELAERRRRPRQPDEILIEKEMRKIILTEINKTRTGNSKTNKRNRLILLDRFGFLDGKAKTFEELGIKYGMDRRRSNEIVKIFLKALRKNPRIIEIAKDTGAFPTTEKMVKRFLGEK